MRARAVLLSLLVIVAGWVTCAAVREARRPPGVAEEPRAAKGQGWGTRPRPRAELTSLLGEAPGEDEAARTVIVCGQVVDSRTGAPIADASVELVDDGSALASTATDDQGNFSLEATAAEVSEEEGGLGGEDSGTGEAPSRESAADGDGETPRGVTLEIDAQGHVARTLRLGAREALPPRSEHEIRLDGHARLFGRVQDASGPVSSASVDVVSDEQRHRESSNDGGEFEVDELPPGEYLVAARADRDADDGAPAETQLALQRVRLAPGEERRVELFLAPRRLQQLRGRVVDAGGAPVAGVNVVAASPISGGDLDRVLRAALVEPTVSGSDGRFSLEVVESGWYTLELRPGDGEKSPPVARGRAFAAPEPEEVSLVFSGRVLRCTLVDEDAKPRQITRYLLDSDDLEMVRQGSVADASQVALVWPLAKASGSVRLTLFSGALQGHLELTAPDEPCVVPLSPKPE